MAKRRQRNTGAANSSLRPTVSWVRFGFQRPNGQPLRILIYARYSTEEQNPKSIDAQVAYCKRFLVELGITDAEISVISDDGVSGELVDRPGINQVWQGIRDRQFDAIVAEDASRPYRHETVCVELVETAVDHGVRVICINDFIDTADEDQWEDKLHEAMRHHGRCNKFTSRRIKRSLDYLWELDAAVGILRPGYRRRSTYPATTREPERGPFFDSVDPKWRAVMEEIYIRVAGKEPSWQICKWLTEIGFPKAGNAFKKVWTDKNLNTFIRREDHRGVQTYRKTVSTKVFRTGKRRSKKNNTEDMLVREMPHLRVVSDALWYRANAVIDGRIRGDRRASGQNNPTTGIPRDSRGPLSRVFACGICGEKMYVDGRAEGAYRCGQVRKGGCWNKPTALKDVTHEAIGLAIIQQLRALDDEIDQLLMHVRRLADDDGKRETRRVQLREEKVRLESALTNLGDAIEKGEGSLDSLVKRSKAREEALAIVEAELEVLDQQDTAFAAPTRKDIQRRIDELVPQLEQMDRTVRDDLECLVGQIHAIPCQQFGSNKVVLRAKFELRLWALLPAQTRASLIGLFDETVAEEFSSIPMRVDLFNPSTGPKYGLKAVELKAQHGWGPTRIGQELGINKRNACIAQKYGEIMREAGITDPFIELTEPPEAGSRWRTHARYRQNRQQDEGADG